MSNPSDADRARRQQLYDSETFSDITICYDGLKDVVRVRAHKAILSMSSDYFLRAFTGEFKEATSKELHLHEDDVEAVTGMLRFIYGLDADFDDSAYFQIQLMIVADKYDVPSLFHAAKVELVHCLDDLAPPDADFYPSLLEAIYAAPACDEQTRTFATAVAQRDLKGWLEQEDFRKLMHERSDISMDVLRAAAHKAEMDRKCWETQRQYRWSGSRDEMRLLI